MNTLPRWAFRTQKDHTTATEQIAWTRIIAAVPISARRPWMFV
ncbi:hypothetical protein C6A87_009590 [Mycobacterium sp. ITM-2016-00317]|nr:hypothetical protein [Mycobacterium sp. ITM-2016-00317]WNG89394.1 hypothetical protein C6A87_009590 [Mycobacterium sp. ITM-2016-00317]